MFAISWKMLQCKKNKMFICIEMIFYVIIITAMKIIMTIQAFSFENNRRAKNSLCHIK